jgi:hypothetical protein
VDPVIIPVFMFAVVIVASPIEAKFVLKVFVLTLLAVTIPVLIREVLNDIPTMLQTVTLLAKRLFVLRDPVEI